MTSELDPNTIPYVEHFPTLTYHYPGVTFQELMNMPRWAIKLYMDKLPGLIAQRQILAIESSVFPHAKEGDQKKVMNRLDRETGTITRNPTPRNPKLMKRALGALGIGVKFVDKQGGDSNS